MSDQPTLLDLATMNQISAIAAALDSSVKMPVKPKPSENAAESFKT
jgi:hypothetical protein